MRTSPELLTDILGVLAKIEAKIDAKPKAAAPPTSVKLGTAGLIASLLGKKGAAERMAEDIGKLKKVLTESFVKNLTDSVEKLREYNELSEKSSKSKVKGGSGWALAAQDMGQALMYMAGGIVAFGAAVLLTGAVLGVAPVAALGIVFGTIVLMSLVMSLISGEGLVGSAASGLLSKRLGLSGVGEEKSKKDRNKQAMSGAKDIGKALLLIAGGIVLFALSLTAAGAILGTDALRVPQEMMMMIGGMALALIALSVVMSITDATKTAKDIGLSYVLIAGGIIMFALAIRHVPTLLGEATVKDGITVLTSIILGVVAVVALLGLAKGLVGMGVQTAKGIGLGILVLSIGILAVASVSKVLLEMFRPSEKDEKGKKVKKGPFAAVAEAAAAIGIFGLFVAGLGALLWVLGLPVVAAPIMLGAGALLGMSMSLILTTVAIKKVQKTMGEMGDMKAVAENIRTMTGGVMSAVIAGVTGTSIEKANLGSAKDITRQDIRSFRRITKIVRMLSRVAKSLGTFAAGLTAFAKLGEIASLDYEYDKDGNITKPIIGKGNKIHVKTIAKSIADTFGLFITTLVDSTENMKKSNRKALKTLSKTLSGRGKNPGILAGVSDFAETLNTFSQFGSKNEIYVPELRDENDKIVKEAEHVPIETVTDNIINSFVHFVDAISSKSSVFKKGKKAGNKMVEFTEILLGKEGNWLRRDKPGILTGIMAFNDTIVSFAEHGKDGQIPKLDENGQIIPGQYHETKDIATKIVSSITSFITSLNTSLAGVDISEQSKSIESKLGSFTTIVTSFAELAATEEGLDKLANSLGLLATNMGLLVTNMGGLDTEKLQSLATVTAQHAVSTKGVAIAEQSAKAGAAGTGAALSQPDWDKIGEIIGNKVAEKVTLHNSTMDFYFHDWPKGKIEVR